MSNNIPQNPPGAAISSLPSDMDLSSLFFRDVPSPPPGNLEGHTVTQIPSSSLTKNPATSLSNQQKQTALRNMEETGEGKINERLSRLSRVPFQKQPIKNNS